MEILKQATQTLDYVIGKNAPKDSGNLSYAMKSTPTILGNIAIVNLGKEWSNRAFKSKKYNYGQLLNDKRVIKNRESKNRQTRIENREKRKFTNTRSVWVKDKRYGNTIRISNRQYQISVQKSRTNKKLQSSNETKDYIFIRNDTSIPTLDKKTRPMRTNRHYHYIDTLFQDYCVELARVLGGKLYKGDHYTKWTTTQKNAPIKVNPKDLTMFGQQQKGNFSMFFSNMNNPLI